MPKFFAAVCIRILDIYPHRVYNVIKNIYPYGVFKGVVMTDKCTMQCSECENRVKERSQEELKDLLNRLNRIEGQVRGIKNMVEKNAYCADILMQVAAATAAMNSFNKVLLANHVRTCVAENIRQGNDEVIDELIQLLQKIMK